MLPDPDYDFYQAPWGDDRWGKNNVQGKQIKREKGKGRKLHKYWV